MPLMNQFSSPRIDERADRLMLRQRGFSEPEIDRLCRLRRGYQPTEQDRMVLEPDEAHLHFLRWLVQKGKLTEE